MGMDDDDDEKVDEESWRWLGPWMSENVYITDLKTQERYQPRVLQTAGITNPSSRCPS